MATNRFKTKLCRNFALGHCPQGDQCKYLHSNIIPVQPPYAMAPAMVPHTHRPGEFNPQFSFPLNTVGLQFSWPPLSPPLHSPQAGGFNWGFQPMSPPPTAPNTAPQAPQFRPLSWRTTLCRHFVKNQGWCPLGDDCGYIHDMALAAHASNDIRFPGGHRPSDSGRAGSKHSHCWAYVQGLCRVKECPYLHPAAITLFIPHTPCLAWPNCSRGPLCAYKHPEPLIPKVQEFQMPAPMPQVQPQPPSPVQVIPTGTVQYHGTTYFPVGSRPPPPPPPPTIPSPHYSWTYSPNVRSVASGYSPYSPESIPFHSPYYETVSTLPAPASVPRAFTGPDLDDLHRLNGLPKSTRPPIPDAPLDTGAPAPATHPKSEAHTLSPAAAHDEFPYHAPPPGERGHTRRVSVAVKSKEDTDALGLVPAGARTTRRESWMGHRARDDPAHRSWPWAPDAVSALAGAQSLQLML